jgi:DNA repair protein RadD
MGRGIRCAPGKDNCLVLDFAGLIRTHGPVDCVKPPTDAKGGGIAPVKECPQCHSLIHASLMVCPDCSHVFTASAVSKLTVRASALAIMADAPATLISVSDRTFSAHYKPGKPTSVLTKFRCGLVTHKAWYCPEHTGLPNTKARRFWSEHGGKIPYPRTADEWLSRADELRTTVGISVKPDGKYIAVVDARPLGSTMPAALAVAAE